MLAGSGSVKFLVSITSILVHSLLHHFGLVPNSKKLQTTIEMWLLKDFKIHVLHRKHCGNRRKFEIANFEQFHLFPKCFPKAFFIYVLTHDQTTEFETCPN